MQRRDFVASVSLASLTAWLAQPLQRLHAAEDANRNGIGVQLWTVRNQMAADTNATLKAIADAGYKQVELMNVLESKDIATSAKDLGMEVRSAFFNWETIATPDKPGLPSVEQIIDAAKDMGLEYMVFGYIGREARDTSDKLKAIADRANQAAEKIQAAGMKMSYHNHSFEFAKMDGDKTGFDIFIDRFDDKLVNFELDVFWAAIGGWDPVATLNTLGSRVGQVHLKDLKAGTGVVYDEGAVPKDAFLEVGNGSLDFKSIMEVALKNGVKQFHVEQDESPDPLQSIKESAKAVAAMS